MEPFMMGIGQMESSKMESVLTQMERYMKESGKKESLMAMESKHGLMEGSTKESGEWENQ